MQSFLFFLLAFAVDIGGFAVSSVPLKAVPFNFPANSLLIPDRFFLLIWYELNQAVK